MTRSLAAALIAAAGLAACAVTPQPARFAAPSGAPAPVAGYDWFLNRDGADLMLAYGVANSDDMKLSLDCRAGSGALIISAPGETGERLIHLESGGDTERYPAQGETAHIHDGDFLTAQAKAGDPVFQRFRRLAWIAAWRGEAREVYAAHPGSEDRVERFFAGCG